MALKQTKDECVQVMVRCRPMNTKEKQNGSKNCIEIDKQLNQVILRQPGVESNSDPGRTFTYDAVYDEYSNQRGVYDEGGFPLVESVMQGYNGTIFAYGQTGCGKTHTMIGIKGDKAQRGIIPNAFDHIFGYFDDEKNSQKKFLIRCSYLEIYNETIRDLLSKNVDAKLELKENSDKGVFVKNLSTIIVKSIPEIESYMDAGTANRKTGETAMNKDSSRSHSIFTIYIETAENDASGKNHIKAGKLNLVDLAGSERQSKTNATGERLKEATQINLSLSALGNVISALVEGKVGHIPYRDSKLTRLLQDSLGGNTKTVMIAAISPADYNFDETLTTLRYASRAKMIKNKPRVNQDPKDALLKQYEEEIQKLRQIIEESKQGRQSITGAQLGHSLKMLKGDQNIVMKNQKEESVEELLQKLAQKGKKVQLLDESVKETGVNVNNIDDSFDGDRIVEEEEQQQLQSSVKKKIRKIKDERLDDQVNTVNENDNSTKKFLEQQEKQQEIIEKTSQQLFEEAQKRMQLEQVLKQMEEQLMHGGNVLEEKEREKLQQQRQMQLELEKEKRIQQELLEEKERQEQELLEKEKHYNSLQDEVEDCRKIIKKLRSKLKGAQNELKDIHKENFDKNEELLDTVREQSKELDFLQQVVGFLMTDEQMYKVKEKTEWDEERRKWRLPPFIIKAKEVQLPKLGNQAVAYIKEELESNEIQFQYQETPSHQLTNGRTKTNNLRNSESRNQRQRNESKGGYGIKKSIVNPQEVKQNGLLNYEQDFAKMSRNESVNSQNFGNNQGQSSDRQQIRNQRMLRNNNENYQLEVSPDITSKKVNNKVGVQLAPLVQPTLGGGRSSMMTFKVGEDIGGSLASNDGTESHPILRVQNYKKPQLEKIAHQPAMNEGQYYEQGVYGNVIVSHSVERNGLSPLMPSNSSKVPFQPSVEQNAGQLILNSKKIQSLPRKRDNAQLAPLNHAK